MTTEIYLRSSEAGSGPFAIEDVRVAVSTGDLGRGDLGWCRGLGSWIALPDLLQFADQAETFRRPEPDAVDHLTFAEGNDWQSQSEEVFFARLARTFAYQLEPLYVPFAELREWIAPEATSSTSGSNVSRALEQEKLENNPMTVRQVLTQFAKRVLYFTQRTAMGFAFAIDDCTSFQGEDRLLLGDSYLRLFEGPMSALMQQGAAALPAFESGDADELQAWLSCTLAELADSPRHLVDGASGLCFGAGHVSDVNTSCTEECKGSARRFIEFATETIRLFNNRYQSARDAKTKAATAVQLAEKEQEDKARANARGVLMAVISPPIIGAACMGLASLHYDGPPISIAGVLFLWALITAAVFTFWYFVYANFFRE